MSGAVAVGKMSLPCVTMARNESDATGSWIRGLVARVILYTRGGMAQGSPWGSGLCRLISVLKPSMPHLASAEIAEFSCSGA